MTGEKQGLTTTVVAAIAGVLLAAAALGLALARSGEDSSGNASSTATSATT